MWSFYAIFFFALYCSHASEFSVNPSGTPEFNLTAPFVTRLLEMLAWSTPPFHRYIYCSDAKSISLHSALHSIRNEKSIQHSQPPNRGQEDLSDEASQLLHKQSILACVLSRCLDQKNPEDLCKDDAFVDSSPFPLKAIGEVIVKQSQDIINGLVWFRESATDLFESLGAERPSKQIFIAVLRNNHVGIDNLVAILMAGRSRVFLNELIKLPCSVEINAKTYVLTGVVGKEISGNTEEYYLEHFRGLSSSAMVRTAKGHSIVSETNHTIYYDKENTPLLFTYTEENYLETLAAPPVVSGLY